MLVGRAPGAASPVLLDFFVEAPGRGADIAARAELVPISVSFGDAVQMFNIGAASVGTYGMPAGLCEASRAVRADPAGRAGRAGGQARPRRRRAQRAAGLRGRDPRRDRDLDARVCGAVRARRAGAAAPATCCASRSWPTRSSGSGPRAPAPFYTGDIAAAIVDWLADARRDGDRGGPGRLRGRRPRRRSGSTYRGREVLTNPPPSAGGILIAHALALLDVEPTQPIRPDLPRSSR